MPIRNQIWEKIASDWKIDWLEKLTTEAPFAALDEKIELMLRGKHKGRTIINIGDA
jgi:hypothetical protein